MSFKSSYEASEHVKKVLAILGDKWTIRVWKNLGWHCAWQWGSVTLYYSKYNDHYHVLIGEPGGCGGHMDLCQDEDLGYCKDPKEAIRMACDSAIEVFEREWRPIQSSVSQVRLSL